MSFYSERLRIEIVEEECGWKEVNNSKIPKEKGRKSI